MKMQKALKLLLKFNGGRRARRAFWGLDTYVKWDEGRLVMIADDNYCEHFIVDEDDITSRDWEVINV